MSNSTYQIRKTAVEKDFSVILNDSLGSVLEFETFDEASQIVIILNSNSDSNCRYELVAVPTIKKSI
jgi:hypothetical protein